MSSTFSQLALFLILHPSWLHPWQWTHYSHVDNLDQLQFKSLSHSVESLKSVLTRFSTFLSKHSCHDESIWSRRITFLQAHVTFRRKGEWDPPLSPRLDNCFVWTYMKVGTGCRQLQGYVCYIVRNCGLTLVKLKKELSSDTLLHSPLVSFLDIALNNFTIFWPSLSWNKIIKGLVFSQNQNKVHNFVVFCPWFRTELWCVT